MGYKDRCVEDDWNIYNIIQSCCKKKCCKAQLYPKEKQFNFTRWTCETKPCYEPWPCCDARVCGETKLYGNAQNEDSTEDSDLELDKDDEHESLLSFSIEIG